MIDTLMLLLVQVIISYGIYRKWSTYGITPYAEVGFVPQQPLFTTVLAYTYINILHIHTHTHTHVVVSHTLG